GAGGDEDDDVLAGDSGPIGALPAGAVHGAPELAVHQVGQVVVVGIGADEDAAAAAAVAAVGAAARRVFLTTEAHGAGAAAAPLDKEYETVDKHRWKSER